MTRCVAIIQARMGSSRLPGKVLMPLHGKPALFHITRTAKAIAGIDEVVVATSDQPGDDAIAEWCVGNGVSVFRGSESDVLSRFIGAAYQARADVIMRLTADCPLLDPVVCANVLSGFLRGKYDYASNIEPPSFPDGLDCEVVGLDALIAADKEAKLKSDREHVTPFLRNRPGRFHSLAVRSPIPDLQGYRWTLDDPADHRFLEALLDRLPDERPPLLSEVLAVLDSDPSLLRINAGTERNEGMAKSIAAELAQPEPSFSASNRLYGDVLKLVPIASQTFSKSAEQYPEHHAPLFLTHGRGAHVWDIDGNRFVDMVSGLLCVGLGYCDPDVDAAVIDQLSRGVSFSLPTTLEHEVAEELVDLIPCAEQVRFGKNGSDVTSAAIRLARAFTKRDHVLVAGYHGWHDWYIGATARHLGVPDAVRSLTHNVAFGDIAAVEKALEEHRGQIAAMIIEPVGAVLPPDGYLVELRDLLHRHGALLIFDEVITGFRVHNGGAQAYFGVTPDLACFGKAMGNGHPISAIVGRKEIMTLMTEIFFSGTFGGEAVSLAAAKAVLAKMRREPVVNKLWTTGRSLADQVNALIAERDLSETVMLKGLDPWKVLSVTNHPNADQATIKTYLQKSMIRQGVLLLASHNINYAHSEGDIAQVVAAYRNTLDGLAEELKTPGLVDRLGCPPIRPVFRVRQS